jgi:putative endonuclease
MTRRLKDVGDWGEEKAAEFLLRHGFKIIDRNFFTTRGEIDIVARKGDDFYFVEVKTRFDSQLANDLAISTVKRSRLESTAKAYCYRRQVPIGEVSLIFAGLIVFVDKIKKTIKFRFVVLSGR